MLKFFQIHILTDKYVLGWPKSPFGLFLKVVWKNPNEIFAQPNTVNTITVPLRNSVLWKLPVNVLSFFFLYCLKTRHHQNLLVLVDPLVIPSPCLPPSLLPARSWAGPSSECCILFSDLGPRRCPLVHRQSQHSGCSCFSLQGHFSLAYPANVSLLLPPWEALFTSFTALLPPFQKWNQHRKIIYLLLWNLSF